MINWSVKMLATHFTENTGIFSMKVLVNNHQIHSIFSSKSVVINKLASSNKAFLNITRHLIPGYN